MLSERKDNMLQNVGGEMSRHIYKSYLNTLYSNHILFDFTLSLIKEQTYLPIYLYNTVHNTCNASAIHMH